MKLLSIFITLCTISINIVYGVTYLDCSKISNVVDKCICYIRQETQYWGPTGDKCNNTVMNAAKKKVESVCNNIDYCLEAYARGNDSCAKALWNYGTSSCRRACLMDLEDGLNSIGNSVCVVSTKGFSGWFCNNSAWKASGTTEQCTERGWRREA